MNGNSGYQPKPTGKPIPPPPTRGSSVHPPKRLPHRELWTDVNNSSDAYQKYTIRFKTNDKKDYEALVAFCRSLMDK